MIHNDELPLLTQDKSAADIALLYEAMDDARIIFRESCRNYILDFIPDWASENEPYECDLFTELDDEFSGRSWLNSTICAIWRVGEGDIKDVAFNVEGDEVSIDYFKDEELLQLIEQLEKS